MDIQQLIESDGLNNVMEYIYEGKIAVENKRAGGKNIRRTPEQVKTYKEMVDKTPPKDGRQFSRVNRHEGREICKVIPLNLAGLILNLSHYVDKNSMMIKDDEGNALGLTALSQELGIADASYLSEMIQQLCCLRVIAITKTGRETSYFMNPMYVTNGCPLEYQNGTFVLNDTLSDMFKLQLDFFNGGYSIKHRDSFTPSKKLLEEYKLEKERLKQERKQKKNK